MASQPGRPQEANMRELKVEDALLYLDQVKMEFQHVQRKPEIYNEFLEIMKNFKAQTIDTPGVIQKVSQLFRGYNKLILGFNTFLPEGHKIKLEDIERNESELAAREAAKLEQQQQQQQQQQMQQQHHHLGHPQADGGPHHSQPPQQHGAPAHLAHHQRRMDMMHPQSSASPVQGGGPASGLGAAVPVIKSDFGAPGGVPGVVPAAPSRLLHPPPIPAQTQGTAPMPPHAGVPPASGAPPQQQVVQHQEFDHAISYVTNIKQRFAKEPETYKSFLDILHTYQRDQTKPKEQQKGIHEVLDQVSSLFADHPDLLKEFTYFLPDAVQSQAKERLERAARESIERQAQRDKRMRLAGYGKGTGRGGIEVEARQDVRGMGGSARSGGRADLDLQRYDMGKEFDRKRGNRTPVSDGRRAKKSRNDRSSLDSLNATSLEKSFFEKVRRALLESSSAAWNEFIQCISLYNAGVVDQAELLTLAGEVLGRDENLYDEFKVILSFHAMSLHANEPWASLPVAELDLSQCARCTPSYRALPDNYPKLQCTLRSPMEQSVLSDKWVSVPMGSEEDFAFKHVRKNQFEEELFKCEDHRFEIDMVIETNLAAIRVLQPLVDEISELKLSASSNGLPLSRCQFRLDQRGLSTVHFAAIARVYGDHGDDILALLQKNPIGAIPVIHRRLEQKHHEWRKVRQELNRQWRPILEQNFMKALDRQRDTFKQRDRKACSTQQLVNEIMAQVKAVADPDKANGTAAAADATAPHLQLPAAGRDMRAQAFKMVHHALVKSSVSPTDRDRILCALREVLRDFLGLPMETLFEVPNPAVPEDLGHAEDWVPTPEEVLPPGTAVLSSAGRGVVEAFSTEANQYTVKLPAGTQMRRPSEVYAVVFPVPASPPLPMEADKATKGRVSNSRPDGTDGDKGLGAGGPASMASRDAPPVTAEPVAFANQAALAAGDGVAGGHSCLVCGQAVYVFFRLFAMLSERLALAHTLAEEAKVRLSQDEEHPLKGEVRSEQMDTEQATSGPLGQEDGPREEEVRAQLKNGFAGYIWLVSLMISGDIEASKYEDLCRDMMGNNSYHFCTMDKLLGSVVKSLQTMVHDKAFSKVMSLYKYESARPEGMVASEYVTRANAVLAPTDADLFQIQTSLTQPGLSITFLGHASSADLHQDVPANDLSAAPVATNPSVTPANDEAGALTGATHVAAMETEEAGAQ